MEVGYSVGIDTVLCLTLVIIGRNLLEAMERACYLSNLDLRYKLVGSARMSSNLICVETFLSLFFLRQSHAFFPRAVNDALFVEMPEQRRGEWNEG